MSEPKDKDTPAAPPMAPPAKPSYTALLRNRSFFNLWLGQLVSQSGDAIFDVALIWLVLQSTGSILLVAITQAIVLLPGVIAGPIAGVYADRSDRRTILIFSNVAQGIVTLAVAALYLTSGLNYSAMVVMILFLYTGAQFYQAATSALVPRIVPRENLGAASGLLSLTFSTNQLAGAALGGIIISLVGVTVPITYDSLTFFFAAFMMTLIAKEVTAPKATATGAPSTPAPKTSFWADFKEGLGYVRKSRFFAQLIVAGFSINFFAGAVFALLAPYAAYWLNGGPSTYGFLGAAFSLGTIIGSAGIGKVNFRGYVGKLLLLGVVAFGVLLALAGLITSIPLALADFFVMGVIIATVNIPISVLVQTMIPRELLGRASTVLRAFLLGAQPIAAVIAGIIAASVSLGSMFLWFGGATALSCLVMFFGFKELREAKY